MSRAPHRTGSLAIALILFAGVGPVETVAGPGAADGPSVYRTWRTFTTEDGLPDTSIRAIRVIDGDVWVGTDAGLALREEGGWRSWTAADGLPEAPISAIDFDPRTEDLWLGTWGAGLVRFTGGRFDHYTQFNSGLAGDLIFDIAVVDGRVWSANNGGISVFEPTAGNWDLHLEVRADVAVPAVTDLLHAGGHTHAGAWSGPLLRYATETREWLSVIATPTVESGAARSDPPAGASALAADPAGRSLWWTSRGRLFRRKPGESWPGLRFDRPQAATGFVNCLAAPSDREAWLGTSVGIQVLSDPETATWVLYGPEANGSEGKLTVVRAGRVVESRDIPPALPDPRVRCLAFEGDDLWVGTPRGLALGTDRGPWTAPGPEEPTGSAANAASSPDPAVSSGWEGEARIGVLGPFTRPVPLPGASSPWPTLPVDRVAVARAVERINDRWSRSDRTLVLADDVVSFTEYGWITAQDSFAVLRDRHQVHGLVGSIEPDATMDMAVALRTELPVVNIAAGEPTVDESLHPWIFRCAENDPRPQLRLLDHVFDALGHSRPAVLRFPGDATSPRLERWTRHAESRGHAPVLQLECDPDDDDLTVLFAELRRSRSDVVLTWADARSTANLVRKLRAAGMDQLVVGGDRIVGDGFVEFAGPDPGHVIALSRCPHSEVAGDVRRLDEEFRRRRPVIARKPVLPQSGRSLDAAVHLAVAIELAGFERLAIRRMLTAMGRLRIARLEDGAWVVEEPAKPGPP